MPAYTVYFEMELSQPFSTADAWQGEKYTVQIVITVPNGGKKGVLEKDVTRFHGKSESGIVLNFNGNNKRAVVVRTGISL